jgi:NAD(P)-dependent dehydrogenase (short-subunit alcohol dehydrogenase family)
MSRSYVVTGGGRGVGRAIVERLLEDAEENAVVSIELDPDTLAWTEDHPASPRAISVIGDVSDEAVAERAADLAEEAGTLSGWVNNAAVFRDASVHSASTRDVLDLIALNLYPAVVGCARDPPLPCDRHRGGDSQRLLTPGATAGPGICALRDG